MAGPDVLVRIHQGHAAEILFPLCLKVDRPSERGRCHPDGRRQRYGVRDQVKPSDENVAIGAPMAGNESSA